MIVIVGAGPAGIAAAKAARKVTSAVVVIDDNHSPGGQIWRGSSHKLDVDFLGNSRVIGGNPLEKYVTVEGTKMFRVSYTKLILATGARELFLSFPGWTLPGVFGVGGLQALAKSGLSVKGKRIIVAGSGPLLLAVGAYLQEHGAVVPVIAEQTSWTKLARFGLGLWQHPSKINQALDIRRWLAGVRYLPNCWVSGASGDKKVQRVSLLRNGKELQEQCDYLAVAYGFVPNTELAQLLGCELKGGFVTTDECQQTSLHDVYCAGEPTGLGGVDESLLEGEVAGCAATGQVVRVSRRSTNHFSRILNETFALRSELKRLPDSETLICRCEDVPLKRLLNAKSWREAKLHYRCGMGPCQGRICGPIVEHYFGWTPDSVRPPVFGTRLENLIDIKETIG